jgi:hypothetical protein
MNKKIIILTAGILALAGCSSSTPPAANSATTKPTSVPATTPVTTPAGPPPAAPNHPSTLESAGGSPTKLLLQQLGAGSGDSKSFTPTGSVAPSQAGPGSTGIVRLRVEWACAPGSAVTDVHLADGSGDISGPMTNGFDGPIPVSQPPAKVVWSVHSSCGWHVRALDQ